MSDRRLRQSFAVDEQDRIVSVREVPRGRACRCRCPRCHEALIARQGDRNKWHFAHENDADCSGGAESALHLAAKQILMKEKRVLLPAIEVRRNRHLFDSRYGAGKTFRPGRELLLDTVSLEHSIGQFRADVYAVTEDGPMIIEIAVTHTVGEEKSKALKQMGIAALEIVLEAARYEEWNWELLAEDVINDPLNRRWLHPLQIKKFEQVALEGAMEDARSKLRKKVNLKKKQLQKKRKKLKRKWQKK